MLRGRDVFVKDYDPALSAEEKAERMKAIRCDAQGATIIEFLYLHGDERGWIWGKNGTTNAAFLHDAAREYFRQFF